MRDERVFRVKIISDRECHELLQVRDSEILRRYWCGNIRVGAVEKEVEVVERSRVLRVRREVI